MNGVVHTPAKSQLIASDQSTSTAGALQTIQIPSRDLVLDACLVHVYPIDPRNGTRYSLGAMPVAIGRSPECAIRDEHPSVSREHALITRGDDGQYRVSDTGSTNGTFVNNASRHGGVLRDGDYLRVGNCLYRFLAGENMEGQYYEEIYRLTVRDGLTQVHNRRYLNEFLEREVVRATRFNRPLALVMLDIDHFQSVNERMGQLAGDFTLKEFCSRVSKLVGADELLARYGGEEFAVVLPEATHRTALAAAERIRQCVAGRPFALDGRSFTLTVSAGVAVMAGPQSTVADLIRTADKNVGQAKLAGRNRVVIS